jgi:lipopolysaccharide transport system permease protein
MSSPVDALDRPAAAEPTPTPEAPPETVIAPPRGWQLIDWRELWRFRELVAILAWRDIKVRYKQTVLGAAWAVLQPGLMMVVFTIFFGRLAGVHAGPWPYPVFVYAGLLPWTFFSTATTAAGQSVVGSERLISKVYFPRLALPLSAVAAALVDFAIAFGLLLGMMLWYGVPFGLNLLLAPLIFAVILLGAVGVGTLLAALHVAYRDFRYVTPFLLQVWLFATPSIYMEGGTGPEDPWARALLALNPLTGLIAAFRAACLGGPIPWADVGISAAVAVGVLALACLYFRKVEDRFADVI